MEAMRKLDATLVAYLAGETKLQSKQLEPELELELDLNAPNDANDNDEYVLEEFSDPIVETVENMTREELQLFRRIKSINLQLEALTLEPEGTKRMELLQNDTRPIFTVECQLSHELIQQLPRYEMFHIMQFESEKFHSLTQCTRFGQEAQRDINLAPIIDELDNTLNGNAAAAGDAPNFGRIHFAVWWREPGTCLNEMLGMGVFELRELYDAALLEQCKRITIQRRGVPLANIYLKINLLLCSLADTANNNAADISCEAALQAMKQHPGGSNKNKNGSTGNASAAAAGGAAAAPNANNQSNTTAKGNNTKDNNDLKARIKSEFNPETLKVRLLTGLISACEVRYLEIPINREMHLVCERFWKSEPATSKSVGAEQFYYQEQFAILRDTNFLNHVRGKHLRLLIYQRPLSTSFSDWNGNSDEPLEPLGLAFLPLHQFFIAFSNEEMTNRVMSEKLPVISIDAWAPIYDSNGQAMGEIKCLLAIGSEEQITTLKRERDIKPLHSDMFTNVTANSEIDYLYKSIRMPTDDCKHAISAPSDQKKSIRTTVKLMDMLQDALQQTHMASERAKNPEPSPSTTKSSLSSDATPTGLEDVPLMTFEPSTSQAAAAAAAGSAKSTLINTDAAAVDPTKPLEKPQFKFELSINCAVGLPLNPGERCKPGTNEPKRSVSKRFPPGEPPSTYVTFQATSCDISSGCYKSHEGNVYATRVVMRSVVPHWLQTFLVTVDEDYLKNPKQSFVLKLWKKANVPPANDSRINNTSEMEPTPNDDAIIGFTALDLSVFLKGLHLAGVFNVFDFNGRITARLELGAKPADDWYVQYLVEHVWDKTHTEQPRPRPIMRMTPAAAAAARAAKAAAAGAGAGAAPAPSTTDTTADTEMLEFGKSLDISHLNLNEAVNHKYNELKVISERLRTRLVDVTGESLSETFNLDDLNNWQPLNEVINADVEMDEFERDINDPSAAANDAGTNKSDNKNKNLISKTAPGAAEPTIE